MAAPAASVRWSHAMAPSVKQTPGNELEGTTRVGLYTKIRRVFSGRLDVAVHARRAAPLIQIEQAPGLSGARSRASRPAATWLANRSAAQSTNRRSNHHVKIGECELLTFSTFNRAYHSDAPYVAKRLTRCSCEKGAPMREHLDITALAVAAILGILLPVCIIYMRQSIKFQRQQLIKDLEGNFQHKTPGKGRDQVIPSFEFVKYKYFLDADREGPSRTQDVPSYILLLASVPLVICLFVFGCVAISTVMSLAVKQDHAGSFGLNTLLKRGMPRSSSPMSEVTCSSFGICCARSRILIWARPAAGQRPTYPVWHRDRSAHCPRLDAVRPGCAGHRELLVHSDLPDRLRRRLRS
jgi:hypothetical protein